MNIFSIVKNKNKMKKYYSLYKGKRVRAAKGDKGKRAFIIYNNVAGERRISKILYYANWLLNY